MGSSIAALQGTMAKVAVIIGSNGLIWQATCRCLAQLGHTTVGAEGAGDWPHYQCDLKDLGVAHLGKDWLDVPPEQFHDTKNVHTPFFASQFVAKRLIAAGQTGAIVNTASRAVQHGCPTATARQWPKTIPDSTDRITRSAVRATARIIRAVER
jgi:NAD(P)-dependent dehydrogenase (short-subunit alcohol dehydrogenase family)